MATMGNNDSSEPMDDEPVDTEMQGQEPGNPAGESMRNTSTMDPVTMAQMDSQGAENIPPQHAHPDHFGADRMQSQMQEQAFRQAQASKQMVYGVYGNCITMLEELEAREQKHKKSKQLPRSNIDLPDQSQFDDATIQRKLDTQLILLGAQLTSCHNGIKDEVKQELKEHTLNWSSRREEMHLPQGLADTYSAKLFELLELGKTDYPKEFDQPPTISESGMQQAMQAIMKGNQEKSQLDEEFKKQPNKKASAPKTRKGAGIDKGADRITRSKPELHSSVNNHRSSLR